MGMDPIGEDEVFEVTVMLDGKVTWASYRKFLKTFIEFVEEARKIPDGTTTLPDGTPGKLKVRPSRTGVRKRPA